MLDLLLSASWRNDHDAVNRVIKTRAMALCDRILRAVLLRGPLPEHRRQRIRNLRSLRDINGEYRVVFAAFSRRQSGINLTEGLGSVETVDLARVVETFHQIVFANFPKLIQLLRPVRILSLAVTLNRKQRGRQGDRSRWCVRDRQGRTGRCRSSARVGKIRNAR